MPRARQKAESTLAENANRLLRNGECPDCERMLNQMNDAFFAVHHFVILNYENRSQDDNYLGKLGRLIHAQVTAHRELVRHQRIH